MCKPRMSDMSTNEQHVICMKKGMLSNAPMPHDVEGL